MRDRTIALQRINDDRFAADQNQIDIGKFRDGLERGGHHDSRTVVSAHRIEGDGVARPHPEAPSVVPAVDNLPPPVVPIGAHLMPEVGFSGRRFGRRRRSTQCVMGPTHSTLGP